MADFLTRCLKMDKKDRIPATQLAQHPVFKTVKDQVEIMIAEVRMSSSLMESELSKKSVKGIISAEILKYNFLIDFAKKLTNLDNYNLASLYI